VPSLELIILKVHRLLDCALKYMFTSHILWSKLQA